MDHPQGYERPQNFKTEQEKRQQAEAAKQHRLKLIFDSYVHDYEKTMSPESAKSLAALMSGYKPD
jgi:hypothetical protein